MVVWLSHSPGRWHSSERRRTRARATPQTGDPAGEQQSDRETERPSGPAPRDDGRLQRQPPLQAVSRAARRVADTRRLALRRRSFGLAPMMTAPTKRNRGEGADEERSRRAGRQAEEAEEGADAGGGGDRQAEEADEGGGRQAQGVMRGGGRGGGGQAGEADEGRQTSTGGRCGEEEEAGEEETDKHGRQMRGEADKRRGQMRRGERQTSRGADKQRSSTGQVWGRVAGQQITYLECPSSVLFQLIPKRG